MYRKCETFAFLHACSPTEDSRSGPATLTAFCKPLLVPPVHPGYFVAGCEWSGSFPACSDWQVCCTPAPQGWLLAPHAVRAHGFQVASGQPLAQWCHPAKQGIPRATPSLPGPAGLLGGWWSTLSQGDEADVRSCLRGGAEGILQPRGSAGFFLQGRRLFCVRRECVA